MKIRSVTLLLLIINQVNALSEANIKVIKNLTSSKILISSNKAQENFEIGPDKIFNLNKQITIPFISISKYIKQFVSDNDTPYIPNDAIIIQMLELSNKNDCIKKKIASIWQCESGIVCVPNNNKSDRKYEILVENKPEKKLDLSMLNLILQIGKNGKITVHDQKTS